MTTTKSGLASPPSNATLLVTGATGFFGRSVLRFLMQVAGPHADPGWSLTALSRDPVAFTQAYPEFSGVAWLSFCQGDVMNPETFPAGQFTHVIHAAAESTGGSTQNAIERFDQIVEGTRHVLQWAAAHGVERFLYTSSGAVYGPQPLDLGKISEGWYGSPDPMLGSSAYGIAKRAAEHLCLLYSERHGMQTVVARGFAFVGPDLPLDAHFAIGNFIRDALHEPEIVVKGDGSPLRSYLYQEDLAEWLLTMLVQGQPGRCYNLGSDQPVSIAELARLVAATVSPGKPVRVLGHQNAGSAERSRYVPDTHRAAAELGLQIKVPLAEAIARTAAALRNSCGD
jgi:UDP-glucuronate decarboxylase